MIATRTTGALAGLILSTVLVAGSALAANPATPRPAAPSAPAAPNAPAAPVVPAAGSYSARCANEWLTARADKSVAALQAVGDCEIDRRLDTIAKLRTGIANATAMTAGHKSALGGILDGSESGLTALGVKIAADTTLDALRVDIHAIFDDYRIYALVVRQVGLVRADDAVTAAAARLTEAATKLETGITQAQSNGKDVTVATAQLATMQGAIAAALAQVDGDAAAVLALTPAGYNAGTAAPILDAARASITAARADLNAAIDACKAAIASLK